MKRSNFVVVKNFSEKLYMGLDTLTNFEKGRIITLRVNGKMCQRLLKSEYIKLWDGEE